MALRGLDRLLLGIEVLNGIDNLYMLVFGQPSTLFWHGNHKSLGYDFRLPAVSDMGTSIAGRVFPC
jgi:hypothetical protein